MVYEIELLKIPALEIKERLNINYIALIAYVLVNTNNFSNGKYYFNDKKDITHYMLTYDPEMDYFLVYNDFIESFMVFNEKLKKCKKFKPYWKERYIFREFITGLCEVGIITPEFTRKCFYKSKEIREHFVNTTEISENKIDELAKSQKI